MRPASFADRMSECVVTCLWLGKLPLAPGTWGTLGAAGVHALAAWLIGTDNNPYLLPALAALATLASVVYCAWAERFYGKPDPSSFVIDEAAGYLLTVSFFPGTNQLYVGILAFVFFRAFDILKPFPIRRLEKVGGGFGIVLDDLLAGLYAAAFTGLMILGVFA